jgi:hypothetical protein
VNWFNDVDATYRQDLRELNELNFARFDAKLEQRIAQLDAKWDRLLAEMRSDVAGRLAKLETELVRWMFGFWATTFLGLVVLFFRR